MSALEFQHSNWAYSILGRRRSRITNIYYCATTFLRFLYEIRNVFTHFAYQTSFHRFSMRKSTMTLRTRTERDTFIHWTLNERIPKTYFRHVLVTWQVFGVTRSTFHRFDLQLRWYALTGCHRCHQSCWFNVLPRTVKSVCWTSTGQRWDRFDGCNTRHSYVSTWNSAHTQWRREIVVISKTPLLEWIYLRFVFLFVAGCMINNLT